MLDSMNAMVLSVYLGLKTIANSCKYIYSFDLYFQSKCKVLKQLNNINYPHALELFLLTVKM